MSKKQKQKNKQKNQSARISKIKIGKQIIKLGVFLSLSVFAFLSYNHFSKASIPDFVNYQGKLMDNSGSPITTATAIQFSLYNHPTNGNPDSGDPGYTPPGVAGPLLWTETYDGSGGCVKITPGTDGIFAQHLGDCVPFPAYLDFTQEYYLGVRIIETDIHELEATPRVELSTHPYAFTSKRVHVEGGNLYITNTDSSGDIVINTAGGMSIAGSNAVFPGAVYDLDYSANYTNRSLVDKEYVDNAILSGTNNIYTTDGTLSDNRLVGLNDKRLSFHGELYGSILDSYFDGQEFVADAHKNLFGTEEHNVIKNSIGGITFYHQNGPNGPGSLATGFGVSGGGDMSIFDHINNKGAEYEDDYSANYTNRSLVDKEYVDNAIDVSAPFRLNGSVISNSNGGAYATDDFVFGSPQMDDDGDSAHHNRFFFDKSKGAFRTGIAENTEWDDINVGTGSFASGYNTIASNKYSTAMGVRSIASGTHTFALGVDAVASGDNSMAIGDSVSASGSGSLAFGSYTSAESSQETVFGRYNVTGMGSPSTWIPTDSLFVIGNGSWGAESNALTILKNGNMGVGVLHPEEKVVVDGNLHTLQTTGPKNIGHTAGIFGEATDMHVVGDYAYVVSASDDRLYVVDITKKNNPQVVSYSGDGIKNPAAIYISGEYAYIANRGGGNLLIFDISNPSKPEFRGETSDNMNEPLDVYVSGNRAFVINSNNNMLVAVDITDPYKPVTYGKTDDAIKSPTAIYVSGEYAYIVDANGQLAIFDVSGSGDPILRGATNTSPYSSDLYVSGEAAYILDDDYNKVTTVSVKDVDNPSVVSSFSTMEAPKKIWVSGEFLYIVGGKEGQIDTYRVENLVNIFFVGTTQGPMKQPESIFVDGIYAYIVGSNDSSIAIFELSHTKTPNFTTGSASIADLQVEDNAQFDNDVYIWGGLGIGTDLNVQHNMSVNGVGKFNNRLAVGVLSTPTAQLHTTGTVRFANFGAGTLQTDANGNVSVSSDERLKNIQGVFNRGLEELLNINPIEYKWKEKTGYDTENSYYGFSAQNVKLSIPEAVGEDNRGYLTLSDRPILATAINAIKELNQKQEDQKLAITTNTLKTDTNIQTLEELQTSVDENLAIINQTLTKIDTEQKTKNNEQDENIINNTESLATLSENITALAETSDLLANTVSDHENRIAVLEEMIGQDTSSNNQDTNNDQNSNNIELPEVLTAFADNLEMLKEEGKDIKFTLDGVLVVKELEAEKIVSEEIEVGKIVFSNQDVAGKVLIKEGNKNVKVEFNNEYAEEPYITAVANNEFILYQIINISTEGFEIIIPTEATKDIQFTWQAIEIKK